MTDTQIKRGPILFALLVGGVISLLNETLVNVALTAFMNEFGAPATTVQWLSTGFMLITGILVPITAFALEWLTTKQVFIGSLAIFSAGTLIAGAAPAFPILLAGRFIQAIGTGSMIPLMINTTLQITPREKHGGALGLCMLVTLTSPAIAPTLAGIILQYAGWRWLFFALLPFVFLAAGIGFRSLNLPRELSRTKLDIVSVVLSTIGFGAFIYGVSTAGSAGITGAIIPLAAGVVALAAFVWREVSIPNPMLDLAPFKSFRFSLGVVLIFVCMMGAFAGLLLLPIYFQTVLGMSPSFAGLAMLPAGLINGIGALLAGKMYDKIGPGRIVPAGIAVAAASFAILSSVVCGAASPLAAILVYMLMMAGIPFVLTPSQTAGLSDLAPSLYPHGSAIMNTMQMIAASFGSSLFIGIMSARQESLIAASHAVKGATAGGVSRAFAICAGIFACAFVASLFIGGGKKNAAKKTGRTSRE
jgi:DHA2 family lincomycin resistance protein-like MFS transporter